MNIITIANHLHFKLWALHQRIFTLMMCLTIGLVGANLAGCNFLASEDTQVKGDVATDTPVRPAKTAESSVAEVTAAGKSTDINKMSATASSDTAGDETPEIGADAMEGFPTSFADQVRFNNRVITDNVAPLKGDNGMPIKDWIAARIKNAKAGMSELVRLPLAHRGEGWGCDCPDMYIGTDTGSEGAAWLKVETGPHANLPLRPGRDGFVRMVDGYFTGKTATYDQTVEDEVVDSFLQYEFFVIRSRPYREGRDDQLTLLIDGVESQREMPPLEDDRPWLVIVSSFPYGTAKASKKIEMQLQKLKDAGYDGAEYLDSRMAPKLFCCFHLVTAGRYANAKDAKAVLKTLTQKAGFKNAYVRQGW